jgi:hypothetical protein
MGGLPGSAVVAAFGYALIELAFFGRRNQLLPWEAVHAGLAGVFFLLHLAAALAVSVPEAAL